MIGGGGKARKCPEWRSDFFPWRPVVPSGGANLSRFVLGTEDELEKKEKEKCAPPPPSTGLLSSFFLFVFFAAGPFLGERQTTPSFKRSVIVRTECVETVLMGVVGSIRFRRRKTEDTTLATLPFRRSTRCSGRSRKLVSLNHAFPMVRAASAVLRGL